MDDEDFRRLIEYLAGELRNIGAGDLADEHHYARRAGDTGEAILLPPREGLIAMLEAFGRYLTIQDRALYEDAMGRFANILENPPSGAVVVRPSEEAVSSPPIDLAQAPNLSQLRSELRIFIQRLRSSDLEPPPVLRA